MLVPYTYHLELKSLTEKETQGHLVRLYMRRNVEPVTPVTKGFIMKSQYAKAKQTSLE
jgi:hypothetical protein